MFIPYIIHIGKRRKEILDCWINDKDHLDFYCDNCRKLVSFRVGREGNIETGICLYSIHLSSVAQKNV